MNNGLYEMDGNSITDPIQPASSYAGSSVRQQSNSHYGQSTLPIVNNQQAANNTAVINQVPTNSNSIQAFPPNGSAGGNPSNRCFSNFLSQDSAGLSLNSLPAATQAMLKPTAIQHQRSGVQQAVNSEAAAGNGSSLNALQANQSIALANSSQSGVCMTSNGNPAGS